MMLLFGVYLELPWLGIVAVVATSLGMGTVISLVDYLAYAGRAGLFGRLKGKRNAIGPLPDMLERCSHLLFLGFSLYMARPVVTAAYELSAHDREHGSGRLATQNPTRGGRTVELKGSHASIRRK